MNAQPDSREFEFWTPEPIFAGETVFVLASGPSLTPEICERIKGRSALAINSSCMLAPWADLYFTDSSWYGERREIVANWPGRVFSMSKTAKRELPDKVLRVKGEGDPSFPVTSFPPLGSPVIRQGRTSGHTGISLLVSLAAATVALVGFDMRTVEGREHCHSEYKGNRDLSVYATDYVPAFAGWDAAARAAGTKIMNCTPWSAITEFEFADLDEVLRHG